MRRFITTIMLLMPIWVVAAVYQVTSVNDEPPDGCEVQNCTLREAIIAANQNPGEDTIILDDVTYFIYQQGVTQEDMGLSGDLDVLDDLRIVGKFTSTEPLDVLTLLEAGQLGDRVFEVHENVSFYMEQVVIKNSDVSNSFGGVIYTNNANMSLKQVVFSQNKARKGAVVFSVLSDIVINDSVFDNNDASEEGGALMLVGGSLRARNSYFIKNQALTNGGAIHASFLSHQNQATIELNQTFLIENYAENGGGALFVSGTENTSAEVLINRSLIQNNEAQFGGGIRQEGSINLKIIASTLYSNQAAAHGIGGTARAGAVMLSAGGTPFRPKLIIEHSALIENFAEDDAGAILSGFGSVNLLNVTLSNNQAQNHSTVLSHSSEVIFTHVTAYGNSASNGVDFLLDQDSEFISVNSLLVGQCELDRRDTESLGGNIESPGNTCGFGAGVNDEFNVSPSLLLDSNSANNGGLTPTHAIGTTSLAIDNALPLNQTSTDQRVI